MSEAIASKEERLVRYNANIAAADKDPQLSPETGKPLSKVNTIRFGAGFLLFGVLWMSGLGIVSAVLLPMHYKTIEGADPDALVGIVNAFTAVASLVANLMFGNFSDRSRSRFGRRTPWIVFGAVLGGGSGQRGGLGRLGHPPLPVGRVIAGPLIRRHRGTVCQQRPSVFARNLTGAPSRRHYI